MLRYLSSYLFQNENQPNENDPTTPISNSEQEGPSTRKEDDAKRKEEFMEFMEEGRGESDEDEDDWVLIGDGDKKINVRVQEKVEEGESSRMQVQPVSLVAAPSEPEKVEEDEEEEDDQDESEDEEDEEDDEEGTGLLWENKLIEHPSMSVYVDLATSINSNSISVSSIAPATSPGESVIVLEQADEGSEEEDEAMDVIEMATSPQVVATPEPTEVQEELNPSDMENNVNVANQVKSKPTGAAPAAKPTAGPAVQNGRRKKGHYPCTSTNSSQMPRRAHLRSGGGNPRVNQTFQMISSNPWTTSQNGNVSPPTGQLPDSLNDASMNKRKRASNTATTGNAAASACGIAMVGSGVAPGSPTAPNMIHKNLKLVEMFPTAAASSKKRQRSAKQANATPKGHFLQESKRRQDLQKHTKKSFVNNDRRSAQQRHVQKGAASAGGNTK